MGLFLTPVLTLWATAILTVTYGGELLYSEFGAIIWRDLRTLSLLRDSLRYNLYACVI